MMLLLFNGYNILWENWAFVLFSKLLTAFGWGGYTVIMFSNLHVKSSLFLIAFPISPPPCICLHFLLLPLASVRYYLQYKSMPFILSIELEVEFNAW